MAEVHDRIGEARKTTPGDPIPGIARDLAASARLLCFDEMHVTDIADAMILGRLFSGLFEAGIVVVATSNSHPRDLYKNGLNRQLFLPFVDRIEHNMAVVELVAAKDYRLERLAGQQLYFSPADRDAALAVERLWQRLTGGHHAEPIDLAVKGRKVHVPAAAMGVARFQFPDLCEKPLGPLDYLHVAHAFHTVVIENVPILRPNRRDIARRFINLIDTLYDNRVGLVISADAEPHQLYAAGDGVDLFQRTASRLIDMRSEAYQAERGHLPDAAAEAPAG
jgi:cell division protein ZapE